ncbi:MAG: glycosyltransferase [Desulfotalea sp.]
MKLELIFFSLTIVIIYPYLIFPLILYVLQCIFKAEITVADNCQYPNVSIVLVVRNGEQYIEKKIKNSFALDYPPQCIELIIVSDGSTSKTSKVIRSYVESFENIQFIDLKEHSGKNHCINMAIEHCRSDLLLFTDVSAMLSESSLKSMVKWFEKKNVGGVCGKKVFLKDLGLLAEPQNNYLSYEDFIRKAESDLCSIASNEGFLYMVRKSLMKPIPPGVTDDLYVALLVVKEKYRFLFDIEATATLPFRAKEMKEEIIRRRRIVCCSLAGIKKLKVVMNPFKFPIYSWILFSHKVLRRLIPFLLVILLIVNVFLVTHHSVFVFSLCFQSLAYSGFIINVYALKREKSLPILTSKLGMLWHYFCLGNVGTLLGVCDLIRGRKYIKWNPISTPKKS